MFAENSVSPTKEDEDQKTHEKKKVNLFHNLKQQDTINLIHKRENSIITTYKVTK